MFTDIVGATQLKNDLGDPSAIALIQEHHALVRALLTQFRESKEIETAGDSFLLVFATPSDAVTFSVTLQARLGEMARRGSPSVLDRIGIHLGEVMVQEHESESKDLFGMQVDICARVMSLAKGGQILMTRSTFDNARQTLKGRKIVGLQELAWQNHGLYTLAGVEEPVEICEVGETGSAPLTPPSDSDKVRRCVRDI
jgi:class 3 adenylate cyclase